MVVEGLGGCHADGDHGEKDREGGKEPFGVLTKVRPKKRSKLLRFRPMAGEKKRDEVREDRHCRSVGG